MPGGGFGDLPTYDNPIGDVTSGGDTSGQEAKAPGLGTTEGRSSVPENVMQI